VRRIIIPILLLTSFSCDRAQYYPDRPLTGIITQVLGHAGSGRFDDANTMDACKYGLNTYDGIEIDLQMSDDGTIWLCHDNFTRPCGDFSEECFHATGDARIEEINSCIGTAMSYTRLAKVFEYIRQYYPNSFVSLDVKAWSPCGIGDVNVTRRMNIFAQAIIDMVQEHGLENRVMVESEVGDFLWYVKTHCDFIETYLTTFGDFELGASRALGAGFSGVSFKFKFNETIDKEMVDLMHRKGLKIQVWTTEDPGGLKEAIDLGVDFVQTDTF